MLVVIMIGILAAMVVPGFSGKADQTRRTAARMDIEVNLGLALDMFEMDMGRYPTTEEGLNALVARPESQVSQDVWSGPYLKKKQMPQDPWGNEYFYASPGEYNRHTYDLASLGPDGVKGNDDIDNWSDIQEK
jgi:general secretion pathway protein G